MSSFTISGFSDEIDKDIDTQFSVLNKLGIKYFEPRGINGVNISRLEENQISELKAKMKEYGISVSSIGSPVGKVGISEDFGPHFKIFKRTVATAKSLDTKYIRIFSFYPSEGGHMKDYREQVLEKLSKMIDYAKAEGVVLLHENEKGIYGDTGERCLDLMETLGCDSFRAVFDPANFVQCGEDTKKCYEMLSPYIEYMHIKDALADERVVPAGYGIGNVKFILKALKEKGYEGFLSLEPHLGSFEGLADLELDDKMESLPKGGEGTFTVAFNALNEILSEI